MAGSSYNYIFNDQRAVESFDTESGRFKRKGELGKGAFGTVCEYENEETKEIKVMKTIYCKDNVTPDAFRNTIIREMHFIREVHGSVEAPLWAPLKIAALIMPKLNGMSLNKYIHTLNLDDEKDQEKLIKTFYQALLAVEKLHKEHKIIHEDLSADNILVDGEKVHLCDFGLSRNIGEAFWMSPSRRCGPETTKETKAEGSQDVYSLGHMLAEHITPKDNLYLMMLSALMTISDPKDRLSLTESTQLVKLYISDPSKERKKVADLILKTNNSIASEEKEDQLSDEITEHLGLVFVNYVRSNKIKHIRSLIKMVPGRAQQKMLEYGDDAFNNTCIHYAAYLGRDKILTDLLALPSSSSLLNRENKENNRPVFLALEKNRLSTLKLLLETQQIDLHLKGRNGLTLIEEATKNKQTEALKLIQDFQATLEKDRISLLEKNKKDALDLVKKAEASEEKQNTHRTLALNHLKTFIEESKNSEDLNNEIRGFFKLDGYVQTNQPIKEGNYDKAYMDYTNNHPIEEILAELESPKPAATSLRRNSLFSGTGKSTDELKPSAHHSYKETPLSPVELR